MSETKALTERQKLVLETIRKLAKKNNRWPTIRDIGAALGISSPNGVICHLEALEIKGVLPDRKGKRRRQGVAVPGPCPCCGK